MFLPDLSRGRKVYTKLGCLLFAMVGIAFARRDFASLGPQDRHGYLPDGTEYRIRIPTKWSGTLVNDLDAVVHLTYNTTQAQSFLETGYAYSGTNRRPDRDYHFDPRAEREGQAQVIDIFVKEFGRPEHIIQFGCSGGGGVALGMAEAFPDRIDGAISGNGGEGIVMSNQRLDLLFALKALIAPNTDLPIVGISYEERQAAAQAWATALASAQSTLPGRAKILLAGALAQAPEWGGTQFPYLERPNPANASAVLYAMLRSVTDDATYAAGVRYLYDNPAGVMSWNTGVDYKLFYRKAQQTIKHVVEQLYGQAILSIEEDLSTINAYPRIGRNDTAVAYWEERALTGNPQIPVLQVNTAGDSSRSAALMAAYAAGVHAKGKSYLYRQALVDAAGHCTWNTTEMIAALQTMSRRLSTGNWGNSTNPRVLNDVGLNTGLGKPRFISPGLLPEQNDRTFFTWLPNLELLL